MFVICALNLCTFNSYSVALGLDGPMSAIFNEVDLDYTKIEKNGTPFILMQASASCDRAHLSAFVVILYNHERIRLVLRNSETLCQHSIIP